MLLGSVMVPLTALVIPTFILFSNLNLTDTMWAVILPSLLNPFGVYLMQVYAADAVPDELLDAARVDGAGEFRTFLRVALPLLRPGGRHRVAAVDRRHLEQLLPAAGHAGQHQAVPDHRRPRPVAGPGLGNNGGGANLWGLIIIGSLVSIIPLVIAFLALQKYWQGGLSLGALK